MPRPRKSQIAVIVLVDAFAARFSVEKIGTQVDPMITVELL